MQGGDETNDQVELGEQAIAPVKKKSLRKNNTQLVRLASEGLSSSIGTSKKRNQEQEAVKMSQASMPELPIEKLEEANDVQQENEKEPSKEDSNNQQSTQMPKKALTR